MLALLLIPSNLVAAGKWGIEYNYDHPYQRREDTHNVGSELYLPTYRFSSIAPFNEYSGIRVNFQRDNYIYDNSQERRGEYHSMSFDRGLCFIKGDTLIEAGLSDGNHPLSDGGSLRSINEEREYIRIWSNRFLSDRSNLIIKVSRNTSNTSKTIELRFLNRGRAPNIEFKARVDFNENPRPIMKERESVVSATLVINY